MQNLFVLISQKKVAKMYLNRTCCIYTYIATLKTAESVRESVYGIIVVSGMLFVEIASLSVSLCLSLVFA